MNEEAYNLNGGRLLRSVRWKDQSLLTYYLQKTGMQFNQGESAGIVKEKSCLINLIEIFWQDSMKNVEKYKSMATEAEWQIGCGIDSVAGKCWLIFCCCGRSLPVGLLRIHYTVPCFLCRF